MICSTRQDGVRRCNLVSAASTPVHVGDVSMRVGGGGKAEGRMGVQVRGGALDIAVGGEDGWALAGLISQPRGPAA